MTPRDNIPINHIMSSHLLKFVILSLHTIMTLCYGVQTVEKTNECARRTFFSPRPAGVCVPAVRRHRRGAKIRSQLQDFSARRLSGHWRTRPPARIGSRMLRMDQNRVHLGVRKAVSPRPGLGHWGLGRQNVWIHIVILRR